MYDESFLEALKNEPLKTVADYYAWCLSENRRAAEFVTEEFGLDAQQAAEKKIGFSDRSLGKKIPHKRIKAGREVRKVLEGLGLYKGNGRETLRGRVTVPVLDDAGNVVGIRGYKLDAHTAGESVIVVGELETQREAANEGQHAEEDLTAEVAESAEKDRAEKHEGEEATTNDTNHANEEQAVIGQSNGKPREHGADDELVIEEGQIIFQRDDRRYRVRGLEKNASTCTLKVNLMASRDRLVHLDSLDLVKARSRASFVKAAASELYVDAEMIKKDIGRLLLKLETLQAEKIAELKQPKRAEVVLSESEQQEALGLLRAGDLLQKIVADLDACGVVGERTGKLAGYLAAVSRKLDRPLAVVIQSSSSAGKTSLMDAVLAMMPSEDQLRLSNLSGQSLYYLDSDELRHKILAVSEDEGIREASYALKLLQSEGALRHATVGKGEAGRMTTQQYTVEGPVQIFLTTTAVEVDEELANRCLVLSVDETREQTRAIHRRQQLAQTIEGKLGALRAAELRRKHQNAQRLLRPLEVNNPYADQLTFPSDKTRLRRDHEKYLALIRSITLLHQHQRTVRSYDHAGEGIEYIDVTPEDIALANGMAGEILGRSLDELSPQTRTFLSRLHEFVSDRAKETGVDQSACRFTRRDVREALAWTDFQVHTHLSKLAQLEYVLVHRGKRGRRYVYELLYSGQGREGQPFLMGLIDPSKLTTPATTTKSYCIDSGQNPKF